MDPEDKMGLEALRRELRREWDAKEGLCDALATLPRVPPPAVLETLADLARSMPDADFKMQGKALQRIYGFTAVPPRFECEIGAGLWYVIRKALIAAKAEGL